MDFPQVQAAIIDICPEAEQARRALRTLLPELSSTYCCNGDAEAWGLLGNIGPQKIADLSGLDIRTSQLLKDRAKRQQYGPSVEVVPTDDAEKLRYLLGKEGFEVAFAYFRSTLPNFPSNFPHLTHVFSMSKI